MIFLLIVNFKNRILRLLQEYYNKYYFGEIPCNSFVGKFVLPAHPSYMRSFQTNKNSHPLTIEIVLKAVPAAENFIKEWMD